MGAPYQFSRFKNQCHRLQIRTEIPRFSAGNVLSRWYYSNLWSTRHYESITMDISLWCCMQNATQLFNMESFDVPIACPNDCRMYFIHFWGFWIAQLDKKMFFLCRPVATRYRALVVTIRVYFYSNTASLAMANGPKLNRSMWVIRCMTFHSRQMLDDLITFWPSPPKTCIFTVFHLQRMYSQWIFHPKSVIIWTIIFTFRDATGTTRLDIQIMSRFPDHSCTVWRVSWNLTGTILSSSGDDGCVRMWKSKFDNWIFDFQFLILFFALNC